MQSFTAKSSLLRHSSRSAALASADRYSAIRTFFTRPGSPDALPKPKRTFRDGQSSVPLNSDVQPSPRFTTFGPHSYPVGTRPLYAHALRPKFHTSTLLRSLYTTSHRKDEPPKDRPPAHDEPAPPPSASTPFQPTDVPIPPPNYDNYPRFFRRLARSLPHVRRPTRDDFLSVSSGTVQRMRVRIRWFFIRAFRKFNVDDISAVATWFLMSWGLWILVGTTTFASVVFAVANSLRLQEYVARAISDYLTSETGVTIIFESAIVPKWKDSRISIKNVFLTRRPLHTVARSPLHRSPHQAALGYDVSNHPANLGVDGEEDDSSEHADEEVDHSWMMFDLNVDSIDVTLSLWRWLDGKGLIKDAVVKGVRGVLDRRDIVWAPDLNPADFRHQPQPGAFSLASLTLEDVLITVYQPNQFRPYTFSIFRADIGTLRRQWLFYDFLRAENVVGQFDNCLFSLHRPQSIGRTNEKAEKAGGWAGMSRFRIDGVNIDHIQAMTSDEGPISWITSGKLDAVFDIKFPRDPNDYSDTDTLDVLLDALNNVAELIPGQRALAKPPLSAPSNDADEEAQGEECKVVVDIDLRFRDLKAAMPMWAGELGYSGNALVRPIVAFMNANRTLVPIHCRISKGLSHFDGSWTMWETGLMDDISYKVYDALAYHVTQANFNHRVKTVSLWSLQMTASAVIAALRNVVDPVAVQVRELYRDSVGIEELAMG
ncbi:mitochondrial distribution and morphology proteins-domain-containing protein [Amylostereum chailletii]|nr:mitochondrial distribution and morphology proteins-domain-containing protein [Amylostereum chailletii]